MPIYGPTALKSQSCGKAFYRITGDVFFVTDLYFSKCLIKSVIIKIKTKLK